MPKNTHKEQRKVLIQFAEYMISGGAYFWSGYAVFAYLYSVLHWSLWWSTIISSVFGWVINYILQRYWVFSTKSSKVNNTKVTTRYMIITLVDFGLNYLILYALRAVGISPYIGQFISAGFFTIWNYLWYRYWVFPQDFKKSKKKVKHSPARVFAHRAHGHRAYRV